MAEKSDGYVMSKGDTKRLTVCRSRLVNNIIVDENLLSYLIQTTTLTADLKNVIQTVSPDITSVDRAGKLLDILTKRGPNAFSNFIEALSSTGQANLAQMLIGTNQSIGGKEFRNIKTPQSNLYKEYGSAPHRRQLHRRSNRPVRFDCTQYQMSDSNRMCMEVNYHFLMENIVMVPEFYNELSQASPLIKAVVTEARRRLDASHQVAFILENLPRCGPKAFAAFLQALSISGHQHVIQALLEGTDECIYDNKINTEYSCSDNIQQNGFNNIASNNQLACYYKLLWVRDCSNKIQPLVGMLSDGAVLFCDQAGISMISANGEIYCMRISIERSVIFTVDQNDNCIFVLDIEDQRLQVYPDAWKQLEFHSDGHPRKVTIGKEKQIYILHEPGTIVRVEESGEEIWARKLKHISSDITINSKGQIISLNLAGDVFFYNSADLELLRKVQLDAEVPCQLPEDSHQSWIEDVPTCLCTDQNDHLIVAYGSGSIRLFDESGRFYQMVAKTGKTPMSMSILDDKRLCVATWWPNKIYMYNVCMM